MWLATDVGHYTAYFTAISEESVGYKVSPQHIGEMKVE